MQADPLPGLLAAGLLPMECEFLTDAQLYREVCAYAALSPRRRALIQAAIDAALRAQREEEKNLEVREDPDF